MRISLATASWFPAAYTCLPTTSLSLSSLGSQIFKMVTVGLGGRRKESRKKTLQARWLCVFSNCINWFTDKRTLLYLFSLLFSVSFHAACGKLMLDFLNSYQICWTHTHFTSKVVKRGKLCTIVQDFIWKPNKNHLNPDRRSLRFLTQQI